MNKEEIYARVQEHHNYLVSLGYEVLFTALQGSQNYGLDEYTEEYWSDIDTKSVVLPTLDDFVYNRTPVSTIKIMPDSEEHAEVKDIRIMFEMFKKENISYIELLYSDYVIVNPEYKDFVDELFAHRDEIATADTAQFLRCLSGMAMEKHKALCHPYPTIAWKIEKYGFDGKQLHHMVRLYEFVSRFRNQEPISACFKSKDRDKLMNYKKQKDANGCLLTAIEAEQLAQMYDDAIKNIKDEILREGDYGINTRAWDFLNELQARIIKHHILETLVPSFENFKYFSKEEQEAEAKIISANAVALKENIYDYYADDGLENLDADKGERSEFAHE